MRSCFFRRIQNRLPFRIFSLTEQKPADIMGSESRKHMDSLFLFTERSISHEVEYQNHKASFH